jgi:hypothetical protein
LGGFGFGSGQFDSARLSDHESNWVGLGQLSVHLVSGHFGFRVVSSRIRSTIGSFWFQVRSSQLLGHLVSGHFEFCIISGQVGSVIDHLVSGHFIFQIYQVESGR